MASVVLNKAALTDPRFAGLMERLGVVRAEAWGVLSLFWLSTRELGMEDAPSSDAFEPALPFLAHKDKGAVFEALVKSGYVSFDEALGWRVVDNAGYNALAVKRKQAAQNAGKASAAKRARKPAKAKAPKASVVKATPEGPNPNVRAWDAYVWAYTTRYGNAPLRNAKANSLVAQFVKRVGQAEAPHLLAFYVNHNDLHYVHKMHPLEFAVKDAEALYAQMASGKVMTYAKARLAERGDNERTLEVKSQLEAIGRGEI